MFPRFVVVCFLLASAESYSNYLTSESGIYDDEVAQRMQQGAHLKDFWNGLFDTPQSPRFRGSKLVAGPRRENYPFRQGSSVYPNVNSYGQKLNKLNQGQGRPGFRPFQTSKGHWTKDVMKTPAKGANLDKVGLSNKQKLKAPNKINAISHLLDEGDENLAEKVIFNKQTFQSKLENSSTVGKTMKFYQHPDSAVDQGFKLPSLWNASSNHSIQDEQNTTAGEALRFEKNGRLILETVEAKPKPLSHGNSIQIMSPYGNGAITEGSKLNLNDLGINKQANTFIDINKYGSNHLSPLYEQKGGQLDQNIGSQGATSNYKAGIDSSNQDVRMLQNGSPCGSNPGFKGVQPLGFGVTNSDSSYHTWPSSQASRMLQIDTSSGINSVFNGNIAGIPGGGIDSEYLVPLQRDDGLHNRDMKAIQVDTSSGMNSVFNAVQPSRSVLVDSYDNIVGNPQRGMNSGYFVPLQRDGGLYNQDTKAIQADSSSGINSVFNTVQPSRSGLIYSYGNIVGSPEGYDLGNNLVSNGQQRGDDKRSLQFDTYYGNNPVLNGIQSPSAGLIDFYGKNVVPLWTRQGDGAILIQDPKTLQFNILNGNNQVYNDAQPYDPDLSDSDGKNVWSYHEGFDTSQKNNPIFNGAHFQSAGSPQIGIDSSDFKFDASEFLDFGGGTSYGNNPVFDSLQPLDSGLRPYGIGANEHGIKPYIPHLSSLLGDLRSTQQAGLDALNPTIYQVPKPIESFYNGARRYVLNQNPLFRGLKKPYQNLLLNAYRIPLNAQGPNLLGQIEKPFIIDQGAKLPYYDEDVIQVNRLGLSPLDQSIRMQSNPYIPQQNAYKFQSPLLPNYKPFNDNIRGTSTNPALNNWIPDAQNGLINQVNWLPIQQNLNSIYRTNEPLPRQLNTFGPSSQGGNTDGEPGHASNKGINTEVVSIPQQNHGVNFQSIQVSPGPSILKTSVSSPSKVKDHIWVQIPEHPKSVSGSTGDSISADLKSYGLGTGPMSSPHQSSAQPFQLTQVSPGYSIPKTTVSSPSKVKDHIWVQIPEHPKSVSGSTGDSVNADLKSYGLGTGPLSPPHQSSAQSFQLTPKQSLSNLPHFNTFKGDSKLNAGTQYNSEQSMKVLLNGGDDPVHIFQYASNAGTALDPTNLPYQNNPKQSLSNLPYLDVYGSTAGTSNGGSKLSAGEMNLHQKSNVLTAQPSKTASPNAGTGNALDPTNLPYQTSGLGHNLQIPPHISTLKSLNRPEYSAHIDMKSSISPFSQSTLKHSNSIIQGTSDRITGKQLEDNSTRIYIGDQILSYKPSDLTEDIYLDNSVSQRMWQPSLQAAEYVVSGMTPYEPVIKVNHMSKKVDKAVGEHHIFSADLPADNISSQQNPSSQHSGSLEVQQEDPIKQDGRGTDSSPKLGERKHFTESGFRADEHKHPAGIPHEQSEQYIMRLKQHAEEPVREPEEEADGGSNELSYINEDSSDHSKSFKIGQQEKSVKVPGNLPEQESSDHTQSTNENVPTVDEDISKKTEPVVQKIKSFPNPALYSQDVSEEESNSSNNAKILNVDQQNTDAFSSSDKNKDEHLDQEITKSSNILSDENANEQQRNNDELFDIESLEHTQPHEQQQKTLINSDQRTEELGETATIESSNQHTESTNQSTDLFDQHAYEPGEIATVEPPNQRIGSINQRTDLFGQRAYEPGGISTVESPSQRTESINQITNLFDQRTDIPGETANIQPQNQHTGSINQSIDLFGQRINEPSEAITFGPPNQPTESINQPIDLQRTESVNQISNLFDQQPVNPGETAINQLVNQQSTDLHDQRMNEPGTIEPPNQNQSVDLFEQRTNEPGETITIGPPNQHRDSVNPFMNLFDQRTNEPGETITIGPPNRNLETINPSMNLFDERTNEPGETIIIGSPNQNLESINRHINLFDQRPSEPNQQTESINQSLDLFDRQTNGSGGTTAIEPPNQHLESINHSIGLFGQRTNDPGETIIIGPPNQHLGPLNRIELFGPRMHVPGEMISFESPSQHTESINRPTYLFGQRMNEPIEPPNQHLEFINQSVDLPRQPMHDPGETITAESPDQPTESANRNTNLFDQRVDEQVEIATLTSDIETHRDEDPPGILEQRSSDEIKSNKKVTFLSDQNVLKQLGNVELPSSERMSVDEIDTLESASSPKPNAPTLYISNDGIGQLDQLEHQRKETTALSSDDTEPPIQQSRDIDHPAVLPDKDLHKNRDATGLPNDGLEDSDEDSFDDKSASREPPVLFKDSRDELN